MKDPSPVNDDLPIVIAVAKDQQRERLSKALSQAGYRVCPAKTGVELLELAASGSFRAVVVEADLPDVSGLMAAVQLKHMMPELPILLICEPDGPVNWAADRPHATVLVRPLHPVFLLAHLALLLSAK